ncbi:MAG: acyl-CoA dehydrogenase [Burkholderiales bacterium]|nr:acyl-CoA dehydrogenase [Burkholderiales bacterium]
MSDYAAPLADMRFVIQELVGLDEVARVPQFSEVTPELVDQVLAEAGKFAAEVLAPLNRVGDTHPSRLHEGAVTTPPGFKDAYQRFTAAGWNALAGDPRFGGQGLPQIVAMPVAEIWNSANMAFCLCPMLTTGVLEALKRQGSAEQQARFLPLLTSGEWTGTMNLTEPQAGSDLSAVRTRAVPQPDGTYKLFGQKIFITYGEHDFTDNIVHLVLARTPDAPEGTRGISLFIVPKYLSDDHGKLGARNDVSCVSIEHKMGIHASPTCVLAYGDQGGATGYLVGEENEGLRYMFIMMNHARLGVGLEGVAMAERAYQHALAYAKQRVQGRELGAKSGDRVTIIHHPDVRRMLMSMKAQTEAMRALAYTAAGALDLANHHPDPTQRAQQQALLDLLTPIVKGWCTEQAVEIASLGVQVHGGMGFIEETGAAQFYRDARITTIYEGTTGIQAMDLVTRKVAAERGATMRAVLAQTAGLDNMLAGNSDAEVAAIRARLALARQALEEATQWLVDVAAKDPRQIAAGAVPFLKLSGIVFGGALMARAALIAAKRLAAGEGDSDFYRAKLVSARFFAEHLLPQSAALAHSVTHGAEATLALDAALF